jgi:hypothetical protein
MHAPSAPAQVAPVDAEPLAPTTLMDVFVAALPRPPAPATPALGDAAPAAPIITRTLSPGALDTGAGVLRFRPLLLSRVVGEIDACCLFAAD